MRTPEQDPVAGTETEKPAPLVASDVSPRTARPFVAILFGAIMVLLIGGLWIGLSSHWQALSTNAVIALPQLHGEGQRATLSPPAATPNQIEQSLAELKSRAAAMDTRVAALERSANAVQRPGGAQADPGRLDSIDQRLGTLEVQIARAADRDTLSALQDRVSRLEAENSGDKLRQAAATLALANLARAAQEGAAFKPELDALASLSPNDPALSPLQPLAASGVPTFVVLAMRFPEAARNALDAERARAASAGFFARLWADLRSLIGFRGATTAQDNTTADHLARAQTDLNRGDLTNAVAETKAVTGAAATAMAPWLKDAEARLALDRTVAGMNGRVVQALAQQAPQAVPPPPQALPKEVPPKARESTAASSGSPQQ